MGLATRCCVGRSSNEAIFRTRSSCPTTITDPFVNVAESDMVDAGRLHGYVSHDLAVWRQVDTSYDHTQRYAYTAMLMWGCPHLGYGAHMPQAIHRGVFTEANRAWDHLTEGIDRYGADRYGIDEWSLANNWGRTTPNCFGHHVATAPWDGHNFPINGRGIFDLLRSNSRTSTPRCTAPVSCSMASRRHRRQARTSHVRSSRSSDGWSWIAA